MLVVDGLDEDRGTEAHSIAALLPAEPFSGMRIVVSARGGLTEADLAELTLVGNCCAAT